MWRLERFSDFRHLLASRLAFFELNDEAQPGAGSESQSFLGDAQVLASSRTIRPMSWEEYFIARFSIFPYGNFMSVECSRPNKYSRSGIIEAAPRTDV
jgi:hypothetical protein